MSDTTFTGAFQKLTGTSAGLTSKERLSVVSMQNIEIAKRLIAIGRSLEAINKAQAKKVLNEAEALLGNNQELLDVMGESGPRLN